MRVIETYYNNELEQFINIDNITSVWKPAIDSDETVIEMVNGERHTFPFNERDFLKILNFLKNENEKELKLFYPF